MENFTFTALYNFVWTKKGKHINNDYWPVFNCCVKCDRVRKNI